MGYVEDAIAATEAKIQQETQATMCGEAAWFLRNLSAGPLLLIFFFLPPLAALLIVYLTTLSNPKLREPLQTMPLPQHSPSASLSARPVATEPQTPPPAYEESTSQHPDDGEDHPSTYADVQWSLRKPSSASTDGDSEDDAAQFVKGTAAFVTLLCLLVVIALSIQAVSFCTTIPPIWLVALLWTVYGGFCIFALRGLGAWVVLFRNLWGKRGRERLVLRDDMFLQAFVTVTVMLPYQALVEGVRACQRNLCGTAAERDVELGVTPSSARFPSEAQPESKAGAVTEEQQGLLAGEPNAAEEQPVEPQR